MNLSRSLLVVVFISTFSQVYAQDCKSKVTINTDTPFSRIYLDNKLIGKDKAVIELATGRYHLLVMEESDRWDAKAFDDTLEIIRCSDTTLTFNFISEVYLDTGPQDAYVYQDSELVGHTPLFLPMSPGEIVLKKPGYEDKVLNEKDLTPNKKIALNFEGEIKGKNFFEKNIFKILVGGIITLGGVSAYFKLKADNNFDEYQTSGDRYYLDKTHKYDLISGITFGAVQVGFGFLIYYFLSD